VSKIKTEEIKSVADFSKLEFGSGELSVFERQFTDIINFVKEIKKAEVTVKEQHDIILELDDLRPDIVAESLSIDEVLMNAPRKQGRYFVVPKVVE
jgi:aspartyl-tRNA(Asn)/glutamyl-tRNA(Gln) amidotransferase subunit C